MCKMADVRMRCLGQKIKSIISIIIDETKQKQPTIYTDHKREPADLPPEVSESGATMELHKLPSLCRRTLNKSCFTASASLPSMSSSSQKQQV